jgi:Tol biopolymer transport system component
MDFHWVAWLIPFACVSIIMPSLVEYSDAQGVTARAGGHLLEQHHMIEGHDKLKNVRFTVHEGTFLSVDVSPDSHYVAFDLLGDLYVLPTTGGQARRVDNPGFGVARFPRFSPDGKKLAFASDADGDFALWVADLAKGTEERLVSYRTATTPNLPQPIPAPIWKRDGSSLYASSPQGALYEYPIEGNQPRLIYDDPKCKIFDRVAITASNVITAICRETIYPNPTKKLVQVNTSNSIVRTLELDEPVSAILSSSSGRILVSVADPKTPPATVNGLDVLSQIGTDYVSNLPRLAIYELVGERLRPTSITYRPDLDSFKALIPLPQSALTPDGRWFVASEQGRIERFAIGSGRREIIPFVAEVHKKLAPQTAVKHRLNSDTAQVRVLLEPRWSSTHEDLVFAAAGKVWIKHKGQQPIRLSSRPVESQVREFDPVFSPDNQWVAFVTWSEEAGGQLWKIPSAGGPAVPLVNGMNLNGRGFASPRWSSDGKKIVALTATKKTIERVGKRTWQLNAKSETLTTSNNLIEADADGSRSRLLLGNDFEHEQAPPGYWLRDVEIKGDEVQYWRFDQKKDGSPLELHVIDRRTGSGDVVRASFIGQSPRASVSPDGKWVAFEDNGNVFLAASAALAPGALSAGCVRPSICASPKGPVIQITTQGGSSPYWSTDGRELNWHWGNQLYWADAPGLIRGERHVRSEVVNLALPRPKGSTPLLLRVGGVLDKSASSVAPAEILIVDNRIASVGSPRTIAVPANAHVIDLPDLIAMPGYIGIQDSYVDAGPAFPFTPLDTRSGLANGITTKWSPGGFAGAQGLAREDMRGVGGLAVSRDASPGCNTLMPPMFDLSTKQSVFDAVKRCATLDNRSSMLEIYQPTNRLQRQWAFDAGRRLGVAISSEGADYTTRIGELLDGAALAEHPHSVFPYRDDFLTLWEKSGAAWHANEGIPSANNAGLLIKRGVAVGTSEEDLTRNPVEGIIETYRFSENLSKSEAIQMLTILGAKALGLDQDLGTIESGKIADIAFLGADPFDNLDALRDVRFVMVDGILYRVPSLERVWPR